YVLAGRVAEVEVLHEVLGFLGLEGHLAAIQVGHQRAVAGLGELVGDALDLVVEPPPFLDHHHARRPAFTLACARVLCRLGEIAVDALPVRPLEADHLAHGIASISGNHLRATTRGARRPVRLPTAPARSPPTRFPRDGPPRTLFADARATSRPRTSPCGARPWRRAAG